MLTKDGPTSSKGSQSSNIDNCQTNVPQIFFKRLDTIKNTGKISIERYYCTCTLVMEINNKVDDCACIMDNAQLMKMNDRVYSEAPSNTTSKCTTMGRSYFIWEQKTKEDTDQISCIMTNAPLGKEKFCSLIPSSSTF